MAGQARLRASDAEGRLLTEELEQRLEAAFSARTYGQLDALVADLPRPPSRARRPRTRRYGWVPPVVGLAIVIPIVVMAVATILLAVAGVITLWWVWIIVAWCAVGHRRRRLYGPPWSGYAGTYSRRARVGPPAGPTRPSRDYWA